MRLLVITAAYPPDQLGGYELRCRDVVEGLRRRAHRVEVITAKDGGPGGPGQPGQVTVHRVLHLRDAGLSMPGQILHDLQDLRFIHRKIRDLNPEVVYLWDTQNLSTAILPYFSKVDIPLVYDEGGYGLIYLARIHKRGIYFYKNEADPAVKAWLKAAIYAAARMVSGGLIRPTWTWPSGMKICFNSRSALQNARENGVPVESATVIPSAIDVDRFPFRRRERLVPPLEVVVPGRIKPQKGTQDAVQLAQTLARRGVRTTVKLVGAQQDSRYVDQILEAVHGGELEGYVRLLPMISQADMPALYQQSDICFLPTYFKTGFSRVPMEAMASGCLVITYGNEGSSESVENGKTGYVVAEGDVEAAAAIVGELVTNRKRYRDITQAARERVEREYSLPRYLGALETFLLEQASAGVPAEFIRGEHG